MEWSEKDKKYIENATPSEAGIYMELKRLRADLAEVKDNTSSNRVTKESILAIKDRSTRLKAINDNLHLFKGDADNTHTV